MPGVFRSADRGVLEPARCGPRVPLPGAEGFDVGGRAVAEPAVELGGIFKLLPAEAGHDDVAAVEVAEGGEVTPEFFELGDWEDIFLSVAPSFLDVLEGDVSGHARGQVADGVGDFMLSGRVGGG
jgi:hypothetical protein